MFNFIAKPFGYIMYLIYGVVKDYGVALILFTLFTKLVLFPLAVKQQKNTARMQIFQPKITKLQKMYANNKEKLNEETMKLYSEEGVNPMSSCLPMLIQLPIIYGLYYVVVKPITYLLRIGNGTITKATQIMLDNKGTFDCLKGVSDKNISLRAENYLIKAVQENSDLFSSLGTNFVDKVSDFHYKFLGLQMGDKPELTNILILIPIISLIVNVGYALYTQYQTKKASGGTAQPGGMGMNLMMLVMMPLFSTVFAFTVPAALGMYWIWSTVFMFLQSVFLYKIYSPEKMEAIVAKEKAKKKKSGKKSFYEKAMEAQAMQNGTYKTPSINSADGEKKMSKADLKEYERKVLNDARRRMAEKYGEDYNDNQDD